MPTAVGLPRYFHISRTSWSGPYANFMTFFSFQNSALFHLQIFSGKRCDAEGILGESSAEEIIGASSGTLRPESVTALR